MCHACALACYVQDLPLFYLFAYTIGGVETQLQSSSLPAPTLQNFVLPRGDAVDDSIVMVVYVRDSLGCAVRSTTDAAGQTVVVTSTRLQTDVTAFLQDAQSSLLGDVLQQGKVSNVLANVGVLSQILTAASDPCADVRCGDFGTCFQGQCTCSATSGYTGDRCQIAPVPVDRVWSAWVAVGSCSVACGGGTQLFTRTCTPPRFGGLPCSEPANKTEPCNSEPCVLRINGGWSAWDAFGECSKSCPGDVSGLFVGTRSRSRYCNAPVPSRDGEPCTGPSSETGALMRSVWLVFLHARVGAVGHVAWNCIRALIAAVVTIPALAHDGWCGCVQKIAMLLRAWRGPSDAPAAA